VAGSSAWVAADGVRSSVVGLHGYDAGLVAHSQGTNMLGDRSATPYLRGDRPAGSAAAVYVALHVLEAVTDTDADASEQAATVVAVEVHGTVVTARWADGPVQSVDLTAVFPSGV
jgi:hypothetical protein